MGPLNESIGVSSMTKITLTPVPCPVCGAGISGVVVEEESIKNSKRVPVIIPAKCTKEHSVVLFVDRNLTVRDVEAAAEALQEGDDKSSVDKAQGWMDNF